MPQLYDVIVLGAGAAGLMCAAEAGKRGRSVAVLEHSDTPGRKILISGGGRCNFTNREIRAENFQSDNPHFARSALARYTALDFVGLVERHGIPWHEKKLGQLFCDRSARDILNLLISECRQAGAEVMPGCRVSGVRRPDGFEVETSNGVLASAALVIATGGLSIPKAGATGFGYDLARQFGLSVVEPRPALVPLVFDESDRLQWCDLAGVATDVRASCDGVSFDERLLITHRGLSGPAILQVSSYWRTGESLLVDLLPGSTIERTDNRMWKTILASFLPKRLAERWMELHPTGNPEEGLHRWEIVPAGTEGFTKAEVTAGGIDTRELSSQTMEARRVPGLYCIGEVVDVTGHLGGYNFQWAWSSGFAAGQAV